MPEAQKRSLKWLWRLIASIILLIGLPFLGLSVGPALVRGWRNVDNRHWQHLGTPPEVPAAIVDADLETIVVRGQDRTLFECDHTGSIQDNACWKAIDQPREKDPYVVDQIEYQGKIPPPPGTVQETHDVSRIFAERSSHVRYVLLDDGSIWYWDHHADAYTNLILFVLGPICGLALAIVIVVVMWLFAGIRTLVTRQRDRE